MKMKTFARKVARKLGIKWMTDWEIRVKRDAKLTESLLKRLLTQDSNCVDIGANIGAFLEQFTTLAPAGKHLAFEPIPAHAKALGERFPDVEVFERALSNKSGSATFYVLPNRDAWSGLQKQQYPEDTQPIEITVQLDLLDNIVGAERQVDFIKIDVEGAEYEVLKGSVATVKRCRPAILFEHAQLHNENYDTTPEMMFDLINDEFGMQVFNLALTQEFSREQFLENYRQSHASNYDRHAQTNFVAIDRARV